jgi:hypothetical protein
LEVAEISRCLAEMMGILRAVSTKSEDGVLYASYLGIGNVILTGSVACDGASSGEDGRESAQT